MHRIVGGVEVQQQLLPRFAMACDEVLDPHSMSFTASARLTAFSNRHRCRR